jgi:hypothetical protein
MEAKAERVRRYMMKQGENIPDVDAGGHVVV